MDEVHIIDGNGNLYLSTLKDKLCIHHPLSDALEMVQNDKRPLKIINAFKNQTASIIKLENFDGKYLYIVKYLDKKISQYLLNLKKHLIFIIQF